jgi:uncharacterized membrane protein
MFTARSLSTDLGLRRLVLANPVPLLLVLFVGIVSRCYHCTDEPITIDEAYSWRISGYPVAEVLKRTHEDAHPPLYYLTLKLWTYCWGDSLTALRGLSVLFGMAALLALYQLCLDVQLIGVDQMIERTKVDRGVGLLAALFGSLHLAQVHAARTARMYSCGVLLTCLTALVLLRALRSRRRTIQWWLCYGFLVAAFFYTHYYAIFSVIAQVSYALIVLHRQRSDIGVQARGLVAACLIALVAFLPWLPVLIQQTSDVYEGFWIPPVRIDQIWDAISYCGTGLDSSDRSLALLCLAVFSVSLFLVTAGNGRLRWFLVLQTAMPWIGGLLISIASGRSIFLNRYLVFGQVFIILTWCLLLPRCRALYERIALVLTITLCSVLGLYNHYGLWAQEEAPFLQAVKFVKTNWQAEDAVLVSTAGAVNQLRYYAVKLDPQAIDVRCLFSGRPTTTGHIVHLASLEPPEVIESIEELGRLRRIWYISLHPMITLVDVPLGMKMISTHCFESQRQQCVVRLYGDE